MGFTEDDVPDLTGRTVLVTGASSGLGLENARALARRGAHVVLATRDPDRTATATSRIQRAVPDASLEHLPLDLADGIEFDDEIEPGDGYRYRILNSVREASQAADRFVLFECERCED